ncbi:MAG: fimbrillin family protein [Muribaculaceae bacterium]|nr:fimbrillin family protein [Muribaculaceae bacterium]
MKKSILFIAAGALALSACTSSEVIEEGAQSNAIGFQNVVSKESRALTTTDLKFFSVYSYYTTPGKEANAVVVFNGEDVNLKDGAWTYANTRYWVPDAKYYFYAYSCQNAEISGTNGGATINFDGANEQARALRLTGYVCNDSHNHDVVFATNIAGIVGQEKDNDKVAFTFNHILSSVDIEFTSGFPVGYTVEISNVQIQDFLDKGNYSPNSNSWTNLSQTQTGEGLPFTKFEVPADGKIAAAADTEADVKTVKTNVRYVIPHTYVAEGDNAEDAVGLQFEVSVKNEQGVEILNRVLTGTWSPNWQLGYSYTYHVEVTGSTTALDPIVFETTQNVNTWEPGTTDSVKMTFSAN